jgi:protein subunit release factor B
MRSWRGMATLYRRAGFVSIVRSDAFTTRLQVKCQATRQQGLNRFIARRLLLDKIETLQKGYVDAERARIEKIRRQKRKRSRRAKQRMLADKSHHAAKKDSRRPVMLE